MRLLIIMTIIVGLGSSIYQSSSEASMDFSSIDELTSVFEKEGWTIDYANVIIYTIVDEKDAKQFLKQTKIYRPKNKFINESFNTVKIDEHRVKVIYKFTSEKWAAPIQKQLENRILDDKFRHFFKNGQIFSCFQSKFDDKINSNFITTKIKNYYEIKNTKILDEKDFIVMSGVSERFTQYIPMDDGKINIQFAVRETEDNQKIVTVGTPILVIEY